MEGAAESEGEEGEWEQEAHERWWIVLLPVPPDMPNEHFSARGGHDESCQKPRKHSMLRIILDHAVKVTNIVQLSVRMRSIRSCA